MTKSLAKRPKALTKTEEEKQLDKIRLIELALHEHAAKIVGAAFRAPEIDPEMTRPPDDWVKEFGGEDQAHHALIIAQAAWENSKEAPSFLKLAPAFLIGSMKARSREPKPQEAPQLNMTMVQMNFEIPAFPAKKVDK